MKKKVNLQMEEDLYNFLNNTAKKQGILFSGFVRCILINYKRKVETKMIDPINSIENN